jgi:hypothetical protein
MWAPSPPTRLIARQTGLRIALYIMTIALIGGALPQASFAEDAESSTLHDGAKSGSAADPSGSRPAAPEDHAAGGTRSDNHAPAETGAEFKPPNSAASRDNARTNDAGSKQTTKDNAARGDGVKVPMATERAGEKDINSTRSRPGDAGPIDTSITVQPRRPFGRPNKQPVWKPVVGAVSPRNLLGRPARSFGTIDQLSRNAIGMPTVRQGTVKGAEREPFDGRPAAPISVGAGSLAKADESFERRTLPGPNSLAVRPAVPNRAVIDGTRLVRPNIAASSLGGPTKTIAGISGTSIRPKH